MKQSIIFTQTDEAPALATYSLLPIIRAFTDAVGIEVETRDISLAGRILAAFPERLTQEQRVADALAELGEVVQRADANVIKLPNISASVPQLNAAIRELQAGGFDVPAYPETPRTEEERDIRTRYDRIKGSAVNPVLREGNSDRRAAHSVKEYARSNPHSMGTWSRDSLSHVASMQSGDYYGSELSTTIPTGGSVAIRFRSAGGAERTLRESVILDEGEIIDAAVMKKRELRAFLKREVADAREKGVLFSVHLKATMMKISDPIIFGHVVSVYFQEVFEKHAATFAKLQVSPNYGLGDLYDRIATLPDDEQQTIRDDISACLARGPELSMVDSDRGITSLHVPSDFIIDATMPAAIRASGQTWAPDGTMRDTKFVVPDRSYASVYQTVIDDCRTRGAYDPRTMGSISNLGLMARKAEEYGSHDKTFEISESGTVEIVDRTGKVLLAQPVEEGDIFRMCQVKDVAVRDWVRLAVDRARETGTPALFWLDENRAHDAELIKKVNEYLGESDTTGLTLLIMPPAEATRYSIDRIRAGKDTISVTGNVLRDYLTDLFPILELGTSAKMLSIVRLLNGGGLFETGAGGSAPKHVQQFQKEGHLRWDSLGEYLALAVSLEHLARTFDDPDARLLADTLDTATGEILRNGKSPSRKVKELDNRGGHFYLALYWSRALADRAKKKDLQQRFSTLARALGEKEETILRELEAAQGAPVDLGGYYCPDATLTAAAMRPSATLNGILESFTQ